MKRQRPRDKDRKLDRIKYALMRFFNLLNLQLYLTETETKVQLDYKNRVISIDIEVKENEAGEKKRTVFKFVYT